MLAALDEGDPDQEVGHAWPVMQDLRHVYGARDLSQARNRLLRFYDRATARPIPELQRLARTVGAWQDELLAYFTTGRTSNGPTEAVNLIIKRVKRVGFGFRNFPNYRLRLLLHAGIRWTLPTTPPMRPKNTPRHAS